MFFFLSFISNLLVNVRFSHLGHNVITFRPLYLGSIFTFKLSTPVEDSLTNSSHVTINCKIGTLKVMIKHFSWHFAFLTRCKLLSSLIGSFQMHASEEKLQESVEDIVSREVRKATNRLEEKLDTLLQKLDEKGK